MPHDYHAGRSGLLHRAVGAVVLSLGFTLGACAADQAAAPPAPDTAPATAPRDAAGKLPPEMAQALQKAQALPAKEQEKLLNAAALEWLKKDPTAALAWAHQLPSGLNKTHLYTVGRCGELHGKVTADWCLQNKKYGSLHYAIHFWANVDPAAALQWDLQAPEEVRHLLLASTGDGWTYKDPVAATKGFAEVKRPEDRRSMAYGICKAWTWSHPEEAPTAAAWALDLKAQEERLSALYGIGQGWSRHYLLEATAWIKTLKNPEEVRATAYGVVKMLQTNLVEIQKGAGKAKPPAGEAVEHYKAAYAKEWLDQLPLSDAEKAAILDGPAISMKDTGKVPWPK